MTDPDFLIVDDDPDFAGLLARAIERKGYQPIIAHNLQQTQTLLAQHQPVRATVDLKLGNENGLQIIQAIHQCSPQTRIIMLTGYASIATAVEAIKLGAHQYLPKPVTVEELLAAFEDNEEPPQPAGATPVEQLQWEHIQKVLHQHQGNISAAARALGMHRRTLQRKLQKRPSPNPEEK